MLKSELTAAFEGYHLERIGYFALMAQWAEGKKGYPEVFQQYILLIDAFKRYQERKQNFLKEAYTAVGMKGKMLEDYLSSDMHSDLITIQTLEKNMPVEHAWTINPRLAESLRHFAEEFASVSSIQLNRMKKLPHRELSSVSNVTLLQSWAKMEALLYALMHDDLNNQDSNNTNLMSLRLIAGRCTKNVVDLDCDFAENLSKLKLSDHGRTYLPTVYPWRHLGSKIIAPIGWLLGKIMNFNKKEPLNGPLAASLLDGQSSLEGETFLINQPPSIISGRSSSTVQNTGSTVAYQALRDQDRPDSGSKQLKK